jgi:hypothetical protein
MCLEKNNLNGFVSSAVFGKSWEWIRDMFVSLSFFTPLLPTSGSTEQLVSTGEATVASSCFQDM